MKLRWAGRGREGAFVDWLAFGEVSLRLGPDGSVEPVRPTLECGAVHPDAYRQATCAREMYHDGYHATDDGRIEWQTADVSKAGGISCVTIDRATGDQYLTFGSPEREAAFVAGRRCGKLPALPDPPPNRHARRAAKRGGR